MIIFHRVTDIENYLQNYRTSRVAGDSIGFVPTMGALHDGHLSIVRKSKSENRLTVCSIFVNPTQFNNREDFEKYPVTTADDIELLVREQCDVLFLPDIQDIYPEGLISQLDFDVGYLDTVLEGKYRPGHFKGVAQVVKRLLDIVMPDVLYLGQKDFQQYKVIEKMIHDMRVAVTLRLVPTVREPDGLAMSSRNRRLTASARKHAVMIYQLLTQAALQLYSVPLHVIKHESLEALRQIPGCQPEYFEIADAETLQPLLAPSKDKSVIICVAAWLDGVRLIDNVLVKPV